MYVSNHKQSPSSSGDEFKDLEKETHRKRRDYKTERLKIDVDGGT